MRLRAHLANEVGKSPIQREGVKRRGKGLPATGSAALANTASATARGRQTAARMMERMWHMHLVGRVDIQARAAIGGWVHGEVLVAAKAANQTL